MNLAFTDEAMEDLEEIRLFLIEAEVANYREIVNDLIACTEKLLIFPGLGVPVVDAPASDDIRDYFHKKHVLRYQITVDVIFVLRIWHQKENERNE